jgi:hypothetical protein
VRAPRRGSPPATRHALFRRFEGTPCSKECCQQCDATAGSAPMRRVCGRLTGCEWWRGGWMRGWGEGEGLGGAECVIRRVFSYLHCQYPARPPPSLVFGTPHVLWPHAASRLVLPRLAALGLPHVMWLLSQGRRCVGGAAQGGVPGRGLHSFPFTLNLSCLCPRVIQHNPVDASRGCSSWALTSTSVSSAPGSRGFHSFPFRLNLSCLCPRVIQRNLVTRWVCVQKVLKLSSNVNKCSHFR